MAKRTRTMPGAYVDGPDDAMSGTTALPYRTVQYRRNVPRAAVVSLVDDALTYSGNSLSGGRRYCTCISPF